MCGVESAFGGGWIIAVAYRASFHPLISLLLVSQAKHGFLGNSFQPDMRNNPLRVHCRGSTQMDLPGRLSRGDNETLPDPPQVSSFDLKKQWLYSDLPETMHVA